jgi:exoribonuclease R
MDTFKIYISDREYHKFEYLNASTLKILEPQLDFNPVREKLFNQDIFKVKDGKINLLHSTTRSMPSIPGVLVLEKAKKLGKRNGKFLYKCIPDDKRLPVFLIPFSEKKQGFSKRVFNRYITFEFKVWKDKFPIGMVKQNIGPVSELSSFYEYNLYCKSLYASITYFKKAAMKKLREKSSEYFIDEIQKKYNPEIRHDTNIFAIDPKESKDFDDAFSILENDKTTTVSIYIANVSFWLDIMDLWDSFSQRIATIYLPDRKRPMLPTMLSDALCSLIKDQIRYAFTLDIEFDNETLEIKNYKFLNTSIILKKNLVYNSKEQKTYPEYKKLEEFVKRISKKHKYIDHISDSHDLVAYLMIIMNYLSAKELVKYKRGIYRSAKLNSNFKAPDHVPHNVQKFLKMWNSFGGRYTTFKGLESHDMLDLDAYVHITSPIRRLVDLLTMLELQDCLNIFNYNDATRNFYNKWTNDESIEYINKTMRSIRKVQNDCSLLNICMNDKDILNKVYDGFIFDKIIRNDRLFQYMVYIPELKMSNRFTSRYDCVNLSKQQFTIFVFIDENKLKQKIRVEMLVKND